MKWGVGLLKPHAKSLSSFGLAAIRLAVGIWTDGRQIAVRAKAYTRSFTQGLLLYQKLGGLTARWKRNSLRLLRKWIAIPIKKNTWGRL